MVHTSSVALGHDAGMRVRDVMRPTHAPSIPQLTNGIFILPSGSRSRVAVGRVHDSPHNAANLALADRMFLAAIAARHSARRPPSLEKAVGSVVDTLSGSGVTVQVVELTPPLTAKG